MYHSLRALELARGRADERAEQLRSAPASSAPRNHWILSLLRTPPKRPARHACDSGAIASPPGAKPAPKGPPARPIDSLTSRRTHNEPGPPPSSAPRVTSPPRCSA